jgi:hypothetical protein
MTPATDDSWETYPNRETWAVARIINNDPRDQSPLGRPGNEGVRRLRALAVPGSEHPTRPNEHRANPGHLDIGSAAR